MNLNEIATHALAFLLGAATGATGKYFADVFTDKRRKQEAKQEARELFEKMVSEMPDLLAEMRDDLSKPGQESWRDFYVLEKGRSFWSDKDTLCYSDDGTNGYFAKAQLLFECGYIKDVSINEIPKYRFRHAFVERLRSWTPPSNPD